MNNKELVSELSKKTRSSQKDTSHFLDIFTKHIVESLDEGKDVEFLDFGTLRSVIKEQKVITNPKTQKKTLYPPKKIIKLKTSKQIEKHIKNIK